MLGDDGILLQLLAFLLSTIIVTSTSTIIVTSTSTSTIIVTSTSTIIVIIIVWCYIAVILNVPGANYYTIV
jgi:hypothetical protein